MTPATAATLAERIGLNFDEFAIQLKPKKPDVYSRAYWNLDSRVKELRDDIAAITSNLNNPKENIAKAAAEILPRLTNAWTKLCQEHGLSTQTGLPISKNLPNESRESSTYARGLSAQSPTS